MLKYLAIVFSLLVVSGASFAQAQTESLYESALGGFAFEVPEGWLVAEDEGLIVIATSAEVVNQSTFQSGELGGFIFHPMLSALLVPSEVQTLDAPRFFMEAFLAENADTVTYGEAQPLELASGRQAALITSTSEQIDLSALVIELDEGFRSVMFLGTASGEAVVAETVLQQMAESVEFDAAQLISETATPPSSEEEEEEEAPLPELDSGVALPLEKTFTAAEIPLQFDHPERWIVQEFSTVILLSNAQLTLNAGGDYLPNALQVAIFPPNTAEAFAEALEIEGEATPELILETYLIEQVIRDAEDSELGEIASAEGEGKIAYRQSASTENGEGVYYLLAFPDGQLVLIAAATAPDTIEQFALTINSVVSTIEVVQP